MFGPKNSFGLVVVNPLDHLPNRFIRNRPIILSLLRYSNFGAALVPDGILLFGTV
jgi:hypothetical protein